MKTGQKIRIIEPQHMAANVEPGDVLTVVEGGHPYFYTDAPRLKFLTDGRWAFDVKDEDIGWELVEE